MRRGLIHPDAYKPASKVELCCMVLMLLVFIFVLGFKLRATQERVAELEVWQNVLINNMADNVELVPIEEAFKGE
jgi:hypothetical protein